MTRRTSLFGARSPGVLIRALLAAGLSAGPAALADSDVWKTAASGTWGAGGSWVDGTPPSSIFDQATFNLAGAYTVSFNADPDPIGALTLTNAADVTFASSSRPGNPIVPRSLSLVETSGANTGDLVLSNGSTLTLGATSGGFPSTSHPFHMTARGDLLVQRTTTLNIKFGSVVTSTASDIFDGTVNVSLGSLIQNGVGAIGTRGAVTVAGPGSRLVNASLLKINERISAEEGTGAALTITDGGRVECFNATLGGPSSTTTGVVTVTGSGSLWKTTNNLEIGGSGRAGMLNIQPGAVATVGQETLVNSQGRLRLQGGAFDTRNLRIQGSGQFEWTAGTLRVGTYFGDLVQPTGVLAPGQSAGRTTVQGNYTQQTAGTLEIEIGGAAQGTQYDFVDVTGNVLLGGRLDLKLISGFVPIPSQTFVILNTNTSMSGAFNNAANGQRLTTADGGGSFLVNYGAGSAFDPALIVLSAFQAGLAGDFDVDGDVDGRDFLVWQRGGSPNPLSAVDLANWRTNFGAPFSASANSAAVPEPSTVALAIIVAVGSRYRRRRTTPRVSTTH